LISTSLRLMRLITPSNNGLNGPGETLQCSIAVSFFRRL
jgi:hypothetical protein